MMQQPAAAGDADRTAKTDVTLHETDSADIDVLVTMMQEFYAEAAYPLDPLRARHVFGELQREPALGSAFIISVAGQVAGYLVLTLTFSMEYGGKAAFLDDLYVRPEYRGRRAGTAALAQMVDHARALGVRAIHLEVGTDNAAAQSLYRRTGFVGNDRELLTLKLARASHEVESVERSTERAER